MKQGSLQTKTEKLIYKFRNIIFLNLCFLIYTSTSFTQKEIFIYIFKFSLISIYRYNNH